MELISRQQAIDLWDKYHYTIAVDAMRYDAELRQLPPIQPNLLQPWEVLVAQAVLPQPKRGKWIDRGWTGDWQYLTDGRGNCWRNIVCSECGESVRHESNFCPNCGADMREER